MRSITPNILANFHKVYEAIAEHPTMMIRDIAPQKHLSRNTVSKYLKEMYQRNILVGPYIQMNPSPNYTEYVYLLKFSDPHKTFEGLREFPNIQYNALTFGGWSNLVITNRLFDFSHLAGFERTVYCGAKYRTYTPLVEHTTWKQSFERIEERLSEFSPSTSEARERTYAPPLYWGKSEWTVFNIFKDNLRKTATPPLRKSKIQYIIYTDWRASLQDYCTVHTRFYPEGYPNYMNHWFLIYTDHEQTTKSLFSLFPTTPVIMEVDKFMLVFVSTSTPDINRAVINTLYDMKSRKVIREFHYSGALRQPY